MLTIKHWKILCAAVQFFDEELSPSGPKAFLDYVPNDPVTPAELTELRQVLAGCELRYLPHSKLIASQLLTEIDVSKEPLLIVLVTPSAD